MFAIPRQVHSRHSTAPDLALDSIPIGEQRLKLIAKLGHRDSAAVLARGAPCA
jgi:hypothetical protein